MISLYDRNGLLFFTEAEIELRQLFERRIVGELRNTLKTLNRAFDFFRCEAPLLTHRPPLTQTIPR